MTLSKLIVRHAVISVMLLCLAACGSTSTSQSLATLLVNGPAVSGSVPTGEGRIFTLQGLNLGYTYTVHAEIPELTLPDGSIVSDGTLTVTIYSSESAYDNGLPPEPVTVTPSVTVPYVYEGNFTATSSGDYIAVVAGTSSTISGEQLFYNFRIMSSSSPYLTTLTFYTTPGVLEGTFTAFQDYLSVFNEGNVVTSGTYSITLISSSTVTSLYPQLFVYKDATLEVDSLLYSMVTNSLNFIITDFTTSPPTTLPTNPNANYISGVTITGVPFTSGTPTGIPYIVIRGINSPSNPYTLEIAP